MTLQQKRRLLLNFKNEIMLSRLKLKKTRRLKIAKRQRSKAQEMRLIEASVRL